MLNELKKYLNLKTDTELAFYLGVKPNVISNWRKRNTFDAELILTKCENINSTWLLTGKGEMLKSGNNIIREPDQPEYISKPQSELEYYKSQLELTRELLNEKAKYIDMFQPLIDQALKEMLERNKTK